MQFLRLIAALRNAAPLPREQQLCKIEAMQDTILDASKPIFVRDMDEVQVRTGLADLTHPVLSVTLYAFDEKITVDEAKEAVFTTERGEILTLHGYLATGGGCRSGTNATVWNEVLRANQVVVGPDVWKTDDVLKRCTFRVEGTEDLLHNVERFQEIEKAEFGSMPSLDVFTVEAAGARVTLTHRVRGGGFNRRPNEIETMWEIEFDVPQPIEEARKVVNTIVAFLSMAQLRKLSVREFQISRHSMAELEATMKEDNRVPYNHLVRFYATEDVDVSAQPFTGRSFAHVRFADDVELFTLCLKQWLERDTQWRAAMSLMTDNFTRSREISGDRLLSATRWIERIPGTGSQPAISDKHVEQIATKAAETASALGYDELKSRIRGNMKNISEETNAKRLERLVAGLDHILTEPVWRRGIVYGAMKARDMRGQAAHGRVELKNKREHDDFEMAIMATECLAYLMMLKDFPLDADAISRVMRARPVTNIIAYWQHYFQEWGVSPS
jgi:hypothetical protein